jgi:hypothetical protein
MTPSPAAHFDAVRRSLHAETQSRQHDAPPHKQKRLHVQPFLRCSGLPAAGNDQA